jgi:hypothetical protein
MSARKLTIIRRILLAYALLTLVQVATHREDFPLSSFPMFSGTETFGTDARRTSLVGVTDQGEFPLSPFAVSGLLSAARLRMIFTRVRNAPPEEQARFTASIARRLRGKTKREHDMWGLRFYVDSWRVRPGLRGIRRPDRALEYAEFLPPESLLDELHRGSWAAPLPRGEDDWVAEPDASACRKRCEVISDPGASGGEAVRLVPHKRRSGSLRLQIPEGAAKVFVRMRTEAAPGDDVLEVELDGVTPEGAGQGLGSYKRVLPFDGWLWVSIAPGWPPLRIEANGPTQHELVLTARQGVIDVDQVWLAKTRKETPTSIAPVESGR